LAGFSTGLGRERGLGSYEQLFLSGFRCGNALDLFCPVSLRVPGGGARLFFLCWVPFVSGFFFAQSKVLAREPSPLSR